MTPMTVNGEGQTAADAALRKVRTLVNRLLVAAFLALLVVAAAGLWLRYSDAVRDSRRSAENLAHVLSEYLEIRLVAIDSVLAKVVASSRRIGGPGASEREWSTALRSATSGVSGLSSIVITDADGLVTYSTVLQMIGDSWTERPIFQELSQRHPNLLVAEAPLAPGAGNERLVPFGRVLSNSKGEFVGTAVATLVPGQLEDFYSAFDLGRSGAAWVLLRDGTVLFHAGSTDGTGAPPPSELPALAIGRTAPAEGIVRGPLGSAGPDHLTAYRRSNVADLVVAVSLPDSDVLDRWRYEALAVVGFLVLAGGFLFFARRRIDRAVTDAVVAAAHSEAGQDDDRSPAAG